MTSCAHFWHLTKGPNGSFSALRSLFPRNCGNAFQTHSLWHPSAFFFRFSCFSFNFIALKKKKYLLYFYTCGFGYYYLLCKRRSLFKEGGRKWSLDTLTIYLFFFFYWHIFKRWFHGLERSWKYIPWKSYRTFLEPDLTSRYQWTLARTILAQ